MMFFTAYTENFSRKKITGVNEIVFKPEDLETFIPNWPDNRPFYCTAQGGEFMKWVDYGGVICLVDADMVKQRDLTEEEIQEITPNKGEFLACSHAWPLIKLSESKEWLLPTEEIIVNENYLEICAALLIAHSEDWNKLKDIYVRMFRSYAKKMRHHAMTQWLISYIIQEHFKLRVGPEWLQNATWYKGTRATIKENKLYCEKEVVFNHVK